MGETQRNYRYDMAYSIKNYNVSHPKKEEDKHEYITNDKALKFMLAGKSEFVAVSGATGVRMVYKLTKKKADRGLKPGEQVKYIYYLKTKVGTRMVYAGVIYHDDKYDTFRFGQGAKGKLEENHINIRSLLYILNNFNRGRIDLNLRIYHVGKCGRCGKALTDEKSMLRGLGPTCARLSDIPSNFLD